MAGNWKWGVYHPRRAVVVCTPSRESRMPIAITIGVTSDAARTGGHVAECGIQDGQLNGARIRRGYEKASTNTLKL